MAVIIVILEDSLAPPALSANAVVALRKTADNIGSRRSRGHVFLISPPSVGAPAPMLAKRW
jgi:hypothetical protein